MTRLGERALIRHGESALAQLHDGGLPLRGGDAFSSRTAELRFTALVFVLIASVAGFASCSFEAFEKGTSGVGAYE